MPAQTLITLLIVAGAAVYLAFRLFGKSKSGCGRGCGCDKNPSKK